MGFTVVDSHQFQGGIKKTTWHDKFFLKSYVNKKWSVYQ